MDLSDNDFMDLFMKRKPLGAEIESEEVSEVLSLLMA
jgi:succinate dehydrogenase flavin-adding protein (antitoxin of CptAB toxin-antitoxin module)